MGWAGGWVWGLVLCCIVVFITFATHFSFQTSPRRCSAHPYCRNAQLHSYSQINLQLITSLQSM